MRLLVIDAVERIEIAARSAWVQAISIKHGPHCYLRLEHFRADFNHNDQIRQLRAQLQQSNETFVTHYFQTYSEPDLPPIWAMTEVISLGTLRAWIDATLESDIKATVARSLAMPSAQVLNGVLHSLNLIRNISAHHCRLWNRLLVKRLPRIRKYEQHFVMEGLGRERLPTKKLYNYLVVMAIMIRKVAPQSTWASRLAGIVSTMTIKQQREMGFPADWESRELWS